MRGARGSRNGQSKLTEEDVKLIRLCAEERAALVGRIAELNAKTAAAQRERKALASSRLADKFGVSRRVVESIIDGTAWAHVA